MMNNPSNVGKSREMVNEYCSIRTMYLTVSLLALFCFEEIREKYSPREGDRTPSNQILELIKDIEDSIDSSDSKPDEGIAIFQTHPRPRSGLMTAHLAVVVGSGTL